VKVTSGRKWISLRGRTGVDFRLLGVEKEILTGFGSLFRLMWGYRLHLIIWVGMEATGGARSEERSSRWSEGVGIEVSAGLRVVVLGGAMSN